MLAAKERYQVLFKQGGRKQAGVEKDILSGALLEFFLKGFPEDPFSHGGSGYEGLA